MWVWLWWYCKGLEHQVWTTRKVSRNCDFNLWFHYRKRRHFLNCPNVLFSKCTRKSLVTLEYLPASRFVFQPVIKHRETNIIQVFLFQHMTFNRIIIGWSQPERPERPLYIESNDLETLGSESSIKDSWSNVIAKADTYEMQHILTWQIDWSWERTEFTCYITAWLVTIIIKLHAQFWLWRKCQCQVLFWNGSLYDSQNWKWISEKKSEGQKSALHTWIEL